MPPELDRDARADASRRALEARTRRAHLRQSLKSGQTTIDEVFVVAANDEAIATMRVVDLLTALPGHGPQRARRLLDEIGIASSRRIRGLGRRQRDELLARFGRSA